MVDDYTGSRRALTEDDVLAAQALYGPTRCWDAPADLEEAMDYGALATFAIWEVYDDTGDASALATLDLYDYDFLPEGDTGKIGLAISRSLARDMGGDLAWVDADGEGAALDLALRRA